MKILQNFIPLAWILVAATCQTLPRGISKAQGSFYQPGRPFRCLDGSQTIPADQVNDDYCDCADGSDEPGTSACSNGKFYCTNKGFKPEVIPSSRVSDGYCDCCDGTDEYEGKVTCENNCMELGREMREELRANRLLVEEGHAIRAQYIAQGKAAKQEQHNKLTSLGPKRDELHRMKDDLQAKKEAAEAPEKAAKDEYDNWWKEQTALREAEKDKQAAAEAFKLLDSNQDGKVSIDEITGRIEFDKNNDGTVDNEEAMLYLDGLELGADEASFVTLAWPKMKDVYKAPESEPIGAPPTEDVPPAADDDDDDDDADFDEEDFDEEKPEDIDLHEKDSAMPAYPPETQKLMDVADSARTAFNDAEKQYNQLQDEIRDIEKLLALDMGAEDEFYPLRNECYEFTDREYIYKFCPFEKCTQRNKGGGAETNLGTFTEWMEADGEKYAMMKFEKGLGCWNGPDRSATVKFICGKDNSLSNGAEPNRCEYTFDFHTPSACHTLPEASMDLHDEL